VRFVYYYVFPDFAFDKAIGQLGELLQDGSLKHPVASRLGPSEAARAHQETEDGLAIPARPAY